MPENATLLGLIGGCYDAAVDADGWPPFLRDVARDISVRQPAIWMRTPEPNHPGVFVTAEESPISRRWAELSVHFAPFLERALGLAADVLRYRELAEIISESELETTSLYTEVLKPLDLFHGSGAVLLRDEDGASGLSMWRSRADGRLPAEDRHRFETLLPHLQRAMQVHLRLHGALRLAKGITDALDQLAQGALLIDRRGRPIFWNRSAADLLHEGDGLALDRDALRAAEGVQAAALACAIDDAARTGAGEGVGTGGKLSVERPSGAPPISVLVAPLARGAAKASMAENACAIVLMAAPPSDPLPSAGELAARWRLTPAEARTVLLLASGLPVDRIAKEMKLRPATVRTYLKRAYEKTGAECQASLVSRVLRPR
jgi:DNA-binding CsgD family transcriptional regulator